MAALDVCRSGRTTLARRDRRSLPWIGTAGVAAMLPKKPIGPTLITSPHAVSSTSLSTRHVNLRLDVDGRIEVSALSDAGSVGATWATLPASN